MSKIDVVFIRKSSARQDEQGQIGNVQNMLREQKVTVPEKNWFVGTVSRRKVRQNSDFQKLWDLVESDQVGTVYIESQDRWGSADRKELFHLLYILEQHSTRLFDLRAKKDMTESDFATEMLTIVGSLKSEKELQDISYRSLRTRVNQFRECGSWPTGTHPFGYGKACYQGDDLLWTWQPISRAIGQVFFNTKDGLQAGPNNVPIPRKTKGQYIYLLVSNNKEHVESVRMIFDLYARQALSRRQISAQLNKAGRKHYSKPFSHTLVTALLKNPAYTGDTHFGKTQTGELHTFSNDGIVVELKKKNPKLKRRKKEDRIIREDTHEALIDKKTWQLAQTKLDDEAKRNGFAPRNPAYYLRHLFVCGHCGKNMTARSERNKETGAKHVVYVCSTYIQGRCGGHAVQCGYQSITHHDAEQLLFDKCKEMDIVFDPEQSTTARQDMKNRLAHIGHDSDEAWEEWGRHIAEGMNALVDYLTDFCPMTDKEITILTELAVKFYEAHSLNESDFASCRITLDEFWEAVLKVEGKTTTEAKKESLQVEQEHKQITLAWAKATEGMQAVLREELERLEGRREELRPKTILLTERIGKLQRAEQDRKIEIGELLTAYPKMEAREKGEAFRRLFKTVTLFWDKTFHARKPGTKYYKHKTERTGRWKYTLKRAAIKWVFEESKLASSW
jgi:hypothetical protein